MSDVYRGTSETRKYRRAVRYDVSTIRRVKARVQEWLAVPTLREIAKQEGVSEGFVRWLASGYEHEKLKKQTTDELMEELK